ncbi:MAG: hypothetical protein ACTSQ8_23245, partial [Candidatus Helarchaeota archaeon]
MALLVIFALINISPLIMGEKNNAQPGDLPSSFTWRDINGTDYTTSIKNQAPAPTCEAYGLVASL